MEHCGKQTINIIAIEKSTKSIYSSQMKKNTHMNEIHISMNEKDEQNSSHYRQETCSNKMQKKTTQI